MLNFLVLNEILFDYMFVVLLQLLYILIQLYQDDFQIDEDTKEKNKQTHLTCPVLFFNAARSSFRPLNASFKTFSSPYKNDINKKIFSNQLTNFK